MASEDKILISSNIGSHSFIRFALYDTFIFKKRWRRPALFFILMTFFSALCFFLGKKTEDSRLLALVLLSVGLVVPVVYVFMFLLSAKEQADRLVLSPLTVQYTVELNEKGALIRKDGQETSLAWKQVYCAVRKRDCIYLYATPQKAFLLPEGELSEVTWNLIQKKLPNRILPKT